VTLVVVFGSRVKGTARPGSDVDVGVEAIPGYRKIPPIAIQEH